MEIEKQRTRVGGARRWASLIGGGFALYWGVRRRSLVGAAAAVAGTRYLIAGLAGERDISEVLGIRLPADRSLPYGRGVKIRRSVTINRPADQLYRFWSNFENLPRFMSHLKSVRVSDETHSHWVAELPGGRTVEWNAEITARRDNELIGWRATGAVVDHAGSVRFEKAPGGRGTIVRIQAQYNPPGGRLGANIAKLFGAEPEQLIRTDLTRFKQLMETGEIPTTEGQPSGRRESARTLWGTDRPRGEAMRRGRPVEEGSEASFPASDAPSWMAGGGGGA